MNQPFGPSPTNTTTRQRRPPVSPGIESASLPQQAEAIKQLSTAATLNACLSKKSAVTVHPHAFKLYHDDVLAAAGSPQDPIESMLVKQLLVTHHRIEQLHAQAACADDPAVAATYNAAAARLMCEFRKTALALRIYRSPTAAPNLTIVKQQNVAAGDQQIALVDGKSGVHTSENSNARSELMSNTPPAITHDHPIDFSAQSATCGGRQAEPVAAGADYRR